MYKVHLIVGERISGGGSRGYLRDQRDRDRY